MGRSQQHHVMCVSMIPVSARGIVEYLREAGFIATAVGVGFSLDMIDRQRPDLIVIGPLHPEPSHRAFTCCREITDRWPETRVILLRRDADAERIQLDAVLVGAAACLPTDVTPDELTGACNSALSPSNALLDSVLSIASLAVEPLTSRQTAALRLAAEGKTAAQIAQGLSIKPNTVKAHERVIREKFNVTSIRAAIERARRLGVL